MDNKGSNSVFQRENNNAAIHFAIDPGAFRTRFYATSTGILLDQPSVAILDMDHPVGGSNALRGFGDQANELAATSKDSLRLVHPVQADRHNDLGWTAKMLSHFLVQASQAGATGGATEVVLTLPHDCSVKTSSRLQQACKAAGAATIRVQDAALAAFYATELDQSEPCIMIDFGATSTRLFAISDGEVVHYDNIACGGDLLDTTIATGLLERFSLYVSDEVARQIKHSVAAATPRSIVKCTRTSCQVECLSVKTNTPSTFSISSETISQILQPALNTLANSIAASLTNIDRYIIDAAYVTGIQLCGGGTLLSRMDQLVIQATDLPVAIVKQPLSSNVRGAASTCLELPPAAQTETREEYLTAIV